ncbi:transaldolase [Arenibacter sp. M-2]|uniref:transaldolase n=1 Tax=Arenibacter sp. M-2 TaxID=3053612 RepID=UPI0025708489|nr:transaldolase [Arenibacter sp. M-2]MDL5513847.1 transaldolase [Arenibacter sp. M-2]|tara:strand:+ start:2166 stop:3554 length:1389 start_codon:yes stop_codon:yes gene_type:complete
MNKPLLYSFLIALVGCSTIEKKSPGAFFAGEIVNPTSEYVVLFKDDIVVDSAKLNDENRFVIQLDTVVEGLYHFDHSPELQYVYLERGDSLMIRLNTEDFDESLIFSGRGEEINNFLVEFFLSTESEPAIVYSFSQLDPVDFSRKLDSIKAIKLNTLNELVTEVNLSTKAEDMAKASIDYNYYIYKEKYPFWNMRRTRKNTLPDLPDNFYDYRNKIDYNNENLSYHRYYYNYMKTHFNNLSYMGCYTKCEDAHYNIIKNKLHFNQHKLKLIDSLVTEKDLRDNLFRNVAIDYLINVHDTDENNRIFISDFHRRSGNNRHSAEIEAIYQGVNNLQPSNKLPNISVFNTDGTLVTLQEIAEKEKNTVFYFWSGTQRSNFENVLRRVAQLSKNRPEFTFIGINCNTDALRWQSLLSTNQLDTEKQFRTDDFENLKNALVIGGLNKGIITKNGLIVDGFADLYSSF